MDGLNIGVHHRDIALRRGLLGSLATDLTGGGNDQAGATGTLATGTAAANAASSPSATSTNGGGLLGGLTSVVGGVTSVISPLLPGSQSSPSVSAAPSLTSISSSSSISSTASATSSSVSSTSTSISSSSTTSSSSSSSSTTSSSTTSTSSTPPPTATPTEQATPVITTQAGGNVVTITSFSSADSAATSTAAAVPKAFLQNKPLEGGVFAVVGIIGLILLVIIATMAMRKRRRSKLDRDFNEAVSFDPTTDHYGHEDVEKGADLVRYDSNSSSGHGHNSSAGHAYDGYGQNVAYAAPAVPRNAGYPQPQMYAQGPSYGQPAPYQGYGNAPYAPPAPNPIYDSSRTPAPILPPSLNVAANAGLDRSKSLLNSPPVSPTDESAAHPTKPAPAAPLPNTFGAHQPHDGSVDYLGIPHALKVANE